MKLSNMENINRIKYWRANCAKMKQPADDYERVRNHFYGFQIVRGKIPFMKNIVSAIFTPVVLFFCVINRRKLSVIAQKEAVFTCPNKCYLFVANDLPEQIIDTYKNIEVVVDNHMQSKDFFNLAIDNTGLSVYLTFLRKYPFAFFMNLSVLIHMARAYKIIKSFEPKAIISAQTEQDFTSSAITYYCERKGVKNICIQHGEYTYNPSMAFFRFSEYWAWNKETIALLEEVNTSMVYAKVFTPNRLKPRIKRLDNPYYYITYYLEDNELDSLFKIKDALTVFVDKGYKCKVRPHPRAPYGENVIKIFEHSAIEIEDTTTMSLDESMINSRYIVGSLSTVLTEAIINGMDAIIDDVAVPIEYLQMMSYVNLKRTSLRLSKLTSDIKNK